jgi:hypothetical protein
MRVSPEEYERIELRAHSLLAELPVHDVWAVDLPGGGPRRSIEDLRSVLAVESLAASNPALRLLFGLRSRFGRVFGWDTVPPRGDEESVLRRLTAAEREASLVSPGTREGPFTVVFVSPREAISEIRNATVHAASVFALLEQGSGHRLYWAIHVRPVGRITAWYMRLIDPFRRFLIYPAVLRHIRAAWSRGDGGERTP